MILSINDNKWKMMHSNEKYQSIYQIAKIQIISYQSNWYYWIRGNKFHNCVWLIETVSVNLYTNQLEVKTTSHVYTITAGRYMFISSRKAKQQYRCVWKLHKLFVADQNKKEMFNYLRFKHFENSKIEPNPKLNRWLHNRLKDTIRTID